MAVQWRRVTWYSKAIAMALFVLLPFVGFCLGVCYGRAYDAAQGTAVTAR